jgi:hypothetical protein
MYVYGKYIVQITKTTVKSDAIFLCENYDTAAIDFEKASRASEVSYGESTKKQQLPRTVGLVFCYNTPGAEEVAAPALEEKMTCVQCKDIRYCGSFKNISCFLSPSSGCECSVLWFFTIKCFRT